MSRDAPTFNMIRFASAIIPRFFIVAYPRLLKKVTRPPLRYGRPFIWDFVIILDLLFGYYICRHPSVNPAAAARCASRRVDRWMVADEWSLSRSRIIRRFGAISSRPRASALGFRLSGSELLIDHVLKPLQTLFFQAGNLNIQGF